MTERRCLVVHDPVMGVEHWSILLDSEPVAKLTLSGEAKTLRPVEKARIVRMVADRIVEALDEGTPDVP